MRVSAGDLFVCYDKCHHDVNVRIQRGEASRAKLAELNLTEADMADAVAWARLASP